MAIDAYNIYLTFDGDCRPAFEFYRGVFGGDFQVLSTFADAPPDLDVPDSHKDRVMHVSLPIGRSVLMGSDSSAVAPPLAAGNNFSVSLDTGSREESDDLLAKLSAGGTVTMPMETTFWGAYFGMCIDKFGISWMVMFQLGEG